MISDTDADISTLQALSTKLEEDFISPLTAVRGSLEILRDFPKLTTSEQQQFIHTALTECSRLESGIEHLAKTVYPHTEKDNSQSDKSNKSKKFTSRIHLLEDLSIIEVDFSNFEFKSSKLVNKFYDELETKIKQSSKNWYFIVNYTNCSIWPQAWVAFAHRGKKINTGYSLGTVRYSQQSQSEQNGGLQSDYNESDMLNSRDLALDQIKKMQACSN